MQPYQEASEEIQRQGESPRRLANTAASIGGAVAGGALASRALPFLNNLVPSALAVKALNKIDPRFGAFFQKAVDNGKTIDEAREFIKEKAEGSGKAPDKRNIIEQYSPGLFSFIKEKIGKGVPILKAAQEAAKNPEYKEAIQKMIKDHKVGFNEILSSIFGEGEGQNPAPSESQMNQTGTMSAQPGVFKPGQQSIKSIMEGSEQPQASQQGPGAQQLMSALQKLQQARGIK